MLLVVQSHMQVFDCVDKIPIRFPIYFHWRYASRGLNIVHATVPAEFTLASNAAAATVAYAVFWSVLVAGLLSTGCKSAICRFIIPVVIDPVNL